MDRRTLIAGAAAVAAIGAGGVYWSRREAAPATTQINASTTEDLEAIDTSSVIEMVQGTPDAKVTVLEYASFTCPHCASFHAGPYQQLKSDYIDTGKVRFIYRDVYFDRFGLWASMIARCDPNRFFGISSLLYKQQKDWLGGESPAAIADNLRKIGKVAGLTDDQVETCLANEDTAKTLVAWYEKNTAADDVSGTPTLFINGTKHSNMNWADFKKLIDTALED
ncbi:DsbA family protein [Pseudooceanicola sp.]|uniref:DsbA family protein n=1 Tax=Pseudooceanicola sp. TaxID=1914328 RepID=UPI00260754D5|nr:DsbA family protein [Pseudooceanicola sp.]MDF1855012.1 DsbA family protein [Pseudooceanicola sp.]